MPRQAATAERRLQPVSVASVVQRRPRNSAGDSRPLRAAAADKRNQSAGGRTAGVVRELCFVVRLFSAAGWAGGTGLYSGAAAGRVASRRVVSRVATVSRTISSADYRGFRVHFVALGNQRHAIRRPIGLSGSVQRWRR